MSDRSANDLPIAPSLPEGYRWATSEETELGVITGYTGMIQVRVGGTDESPWTDLAVRK